MCVELGLGIEERWGRYSTAGGGGGELVRFPLANREIEFDHRSNFPRNLNGDRGDGSVGQSKCSVGPQSQCSVGSGGPIGLGGGLGPLPWARLGFFAGRGPMGLGRALGGGGGRREEGLLIV